MKSSRQIEIIELSERRSLSELESTTSSLYPSLDIVNSNRYGNNAINNFSDENNIDNQTALSLEQKLFQGGAEFALNDYRKIVPKKAKAEKEKNIADYYGKFSTLYFQVSSAQEERDKIEALFQNLKQRVAIVKKRTKIGRERKADLYALESQLFRLEADSYASLAQLRSAKTELLNFSGLESLDSISENLDPLKLDLPKTVNLDTRPELKSLVYIHESSVLEAKIEKSSYYPQVDFGANYYIEKTELGRNDWDVSLNITLNLLDFGKRSSSVQSKNVTASINRARLDYSRINAQRRWINYVDNFNSKKKEFRSIKQALKRSRTSYKEQLKDLKRGLVTQIEVIRSLDDVISLEKLSIRSALEVKSIYYQANAYLGKYPKG